MKRFKLVVPSFVALIFCALLMLGSTLALFTSKAEASISVTSGKVKINANFDDLEVYSAKVDPDGALVDENGAHYSFEKQTAQLDLAEGNGYTQFVNQNSGAKLLGENNNRLSLVRMIPGDKVTATLELGNESNVNIKYRVKVNLVSGLQLFEQLQIKLDGVLLQGVQKVGTWTALAANADITDIAVEVYFPITSGNKYQSLSTEINFTIEAVQGNAATTNETLNTNINVSKPVTEVAAQEVKDDEELVTVTVPAAALSNNATYAAAIEDPDTTASLEVKVEPKEAPANVVVSSEQAAQSYDVEVLLTTQTGTDAPVTQPYNDANNAVTVKMFVGKGLKGLHLYHTHNNVTTEITEFTYDEDGYLTFQTNNFSDYTVVFNKDLVVETVDEVTKESTFTTYEATETAGVYTREVEDEQTGEKSVETFAPVKDEDGEIVIDNSGEIQIQTYEAKIGDKHYETFLSAVREAKSNDVVEVLTDLTYTESDMIEYSDFISGTSHALVGNKYYLTVDFNNHEVSLSGSMTMFGALIFSEIKNLKLTYNNSTHSRIVSFAAQSTLNNVAVSGDVLYTTGNGAPFITYSQDSITLINCVNKAYIHTSNGDSTLYNSIFIGYVMGSGTVEFTNCKNEGKIVCGKAGFLVANWSYGTNLLFKINNTVNDGIVQSTSSSYYNGNGKYNYLTSDYWDKASCISVQFNNGEVYTASTSSKWYDTLVQSSVVGKGSFVAGPIDDSLTISLNEDGTFTITPSSLENVDHYVLVIGTYTSTSNGSSRTYVSETLEGLTSTLKLLSFVDSQWLAANPSALEGTMAGNKIYSLNNISYYAIEQFETQTVGGTPKAPQMISVSAMDAEGNLLASAGYIGK